MYRAIPTNGLDDAFDIEPETFELPEELLYHSPSDPDVMDSFSFYDGKAHPGQDVKDLTYAGGVKLITRPNAKPLARSMPGTDSQHYHESTADPERMKSVSFDPDYRV